MAALGLAPRFEALPELKLLEPLGYLDFLKLMEGARLLLTDSGGIQEETTILGMPCLTIRENTERPITIEVGTNQLVGTDTARILAGYEKIKTGQVTGRRPDLWDGRAAQLIAQILANWTP